MTTLHNGMKNYGAAREDEDRQRRAEARAARAERDPEEYQGPDATPDQSEVKRKFLVCHKCGQVHSVAGFYAKRAGDKCGSTVSVDVRKGSGGFTKCQAKLKAENVVEFASYSEAEKFGDALVAKRNAQ